MSGSCGKYTLDVDDIRASLFRRVVFGEVPVRVELVLSEDDILGDLLDPAAPVSEQYRLGMMKVLVEQNALRLLDDAVTSSIDRLDV